MYRMSTRRKREKVSWSGPKRCKYHVARRYMGVAAGLVTMCYVRSMQKRVGARQLLCVKQKNQAAVKIATAIVASIGQERTRTINRRPWVNATRWWLAGIRREKSIVGFQALLIDTDVPRSYLI